MCHSFRKCMQSIHFLHFSRSFWLAEKAGQSMLPTVKGIAGRRMLAHSSTRPRVFQIDKDIPHTRSSARALASSRDPLGDWKCMVAPPPVPVELTWPACRIFSRWTVKGNVVLYLVCRFSTILEVTCPSMPSDPRLSFEMSFPPAVHTSWLHLRACMIDDVCCHMSFKTVWSISIVSVATFVSACIRRCPAI